MIAHGYATISWKEDILYIYAYGPFNEEGVSIAVDEYLSVVEKRHLKPFDTIEIWDEETLGSPETISKAKVLWGKLIELNCTSISIVVSNNLQSAICKKYLPSIGRIYFSVKDAEEYILYQLHHQQINITLQS